MGKRNGARRSRLGREGGRIEHEESESRRQERQKGVDSVLMRSVGRSDRIVSARGM